MYDCIVMGGGPAGTTVAALVAEAGFKTLLLEREKFPRFHVGESLMPETYGVFQRLGVLARMKSSPFVPKVSVQFVSHTGKASQPFHFRQHDPHERSATWQVERSRFDVMLFENAAEKGADCRDATRVAEVLFDGGRARGVTVETAAGGRRTVAARVVVDATGQRTLVASALGLKRADPHLRKAAVWGYYRGARRDQGQHAGATVILHTRARKAWFWFIPLADDVTSIGVVADKAFLRRGPAGAEQVFQDQLADCPALAARLDEASRLGQLHVAREFSYRTEKGAGDGWVAVGDAWGFIDPIYSSGVFFALKSGEMAADCLVEGLARGDTSAAQLGGWLDEFSAGARWMRKLVDAFYTEQFSFGRFVQQFPQHRGRLTDLLIGRIFTPGVGEIFADMDSWLRAAEATRNPRG